MCIGIVAATKAEIAPFTAAMRNIETEEYSMLKFHKGNYAGIDVIALFCGVCRVNAAIAAQILLDRYQVEQIIVIGVAGAINPDLQIGDTVISSQVAYHDVADEILTQYHPWMESIYFTADPSLVHGSAQGQVQNLGYQATFPLLLNISGEPTYFMALKDDAGLVKMYAMVNIQKYQWVATGDSIRECEKAYSQLLKTNGITAGAGTEGKTMSGKIANLMPDRKSVV